LDIAQRVKANTEPGIFTALIEDASQYSGAYGQPAQPSDPPLRDDELQPLLFRSIALGSKGLVLRPAAAQALPEGASSTTPIGPAGDQARTRLEAPLTELRALLPWLALSEPAPRAVQSKTPGVQAHALLCGDKGLLVFAFAEPIAQPAASLALEIHTPPGCPPLRHWRRPGHTETGALPETDSPFPLSLPMPSPVIITLLEP